MIGGGPEEPPNFTLRDGARRRMINKLAATVGESWIGRSRT